MFEWLEDIRAYFLFKRDIRKERKNPDSLFNKFEMKRNWLGNVLYMQINCTDGDFISADFSYDRMLENKLKPVVKYLSTDLGWGDYLVPQISHFVDDDGNPSLSFGVLFVFSGYSMTFTKAVVGILGLCALVGGGFLAWNLLK
jgi:hypothetical protein